MKQSIARPRRKYLPQTTLAVATLILGGLGAAPVYAQQAQQNIKDLPVSPVPQHPPTGAGSSVTLYGLANAGLSYASNEKGHSRVFFDDGISNTSRWGLRGIEDLGGGQKALFNFEGGITLATGAATHGGAIFGRRAVVGLSSSNFGTLFGGFGYDFIYDWITYYSNTGQFGPVYGFHGAYDIDRLAGEPVASMLRYETPIWHGFGAGLMYGGLTGSGAGKPNGTPRVVSAGIKYSPTGSWNAPYSLAAVYTSTKGGNASPAAGGTIAQIALNAQSIYTAALAGQVKLSNKVSVNALYTYTNASKGPLGVVAVSAYEAGVTYQFDSPWRVGVGLTYVDQRQLGGYDMLNSGIFYRFSKHADAYLFGVYQHATGNQKYADNFFVTTPYSVNNPLSPYGNNAASGPNQLVLHLGFRYVF
jgi:predicted porin